MLSDHSTLESNLTWKHSNVKQKVAVKQDKKWDILFNTLIINVFWRRTWSVIIDRFVQTNVHLKEREKIYVNMVNIFPILRIINHVLVRIFFCSNRNRSGKMTWTRSYWNWIDRNFILKLINHFQFEQKKLRERNSERDGFSSLQIHHRLTSNFIKCTYIPIKCNRI